MSEQIHQKHEAILAEHGTEIKALHRGQDEMRGDIKTILSAVQSNANANKPNMPFLATCGGLVLTFLLGFMSLVIMPMQELTDKRTEEQDDKNKQHAEFMLKIMEKDSDDEARHSFNDGRNSVNESRYESWLLATDADIEHIREDVSKKAIKSASQIGVIFSKLELMMKQIDAIELHGFRADNKLNHHNHDK
jgi:hypothetical protein